MTNWFKQLIGVDPNDTVGAVEFGWGSAWADQYTALVLFACVAVVGLSLVYYFKMQPTDRPRLRMMACIGRIVCLVALVIVLAQPVLHVDLIEELRPQLLLVFDGSDSMNLAAATSTTEPLGDPSPETRLQRVKSALVDSQDTFARLSRNYRLRAYVSGDHGRLRELGIVGATDTDSSPVDTKALASQLSADATVTALGAGLEEVGRRHRGRLLGGVVLLSDFNENSGVPALTACRQLEAPIYTIGVGAREAPDAAVSLHSDLVIKKDEQRTVTVQIRQSGLDGAIARLELVARRLGSVSGAIEEELTSTPIGGPQMVDFSADLMTVDIPYKPDRVGRYRLEARIENLDGEIITENNVASREVVVRDEAVKLLFIEDQPTWEWRFVKEVFHRDRLVGREGFRTYLHSADFGVRHSSELFLSSLSPSRAEFFANDLIFISDIPAELLTPDFQNMLVEYVRDFGGGLVVIAGPRFTAKSLSQTRVADMLPVNLDPVGRPRIGDFRMQLTPAGAIEDFMVLADPGRPNEKAWDSLGELPWYQPVANLHPQGLSLAVHPLDRCADGETPQPIIATRRFGKGEVVYVGINEMWRLRRFHGEKYYRRFWGQLMYRLGLSHALGPQKRFKVATDREQYRVGDNVTISVEAYDGNFRPLSDTDLPEAHLIGQLISTSPEGGEDSKTLKIPSTANDAVFETSVSIFTEGAHRLLVSDPVTGEEVEVSFNVSPLSVERRSAARNLTLQQTLASQTGGCPYELDELAKLADDVAIAPVIETSPLYVPLWNTWLVVALVSCGTAERMDNTKPCGSIMTDLAKLTTRLRSLRRTRSMLAWTQSLAAVVGIALWSLIAAFAIDVTLQMRLVERTFVLVIYLGILVWACRRFLSQVLLRRDSLVDMALLTEQQQGIASDLVAALQFADPTRRQFGLDELRAAVIGDTAELTDSLEIRCGYSWNDFRRRTWIVLVAGAVIGIACLLCGGHVEAFAKRFLLGDASYPTRTTIRVTAPGDHAGFGQPVAFVVEASGRLPDDGTVHIVGDAGGETTVVRLAPDVQTASTYVGQLPRAIESFSYVVELGDARSQEHAVRVLPLPKVVVELDITTPEYAANKLGELGQRSGQHAAFAGSRVVPVVTADKKLRRATIDINGKSFAMTPRGSAFVLDTSDRLLARLSESLRYQVQVEDVDGLKLERPTGGVLRVIHDRPPMVTCSTVSVQVLPTAAPMIHVAASDDFGIRRVVLHGTVIRQTETGQETEGPAQALHELRDPGASVDRAVTIDVSKLDLAVGDRLICVAEVTDDRGGLPSESASSPPLMFEIVDRETVLANLRDFGTKMDSKLNDIIQTQSNVGER